MRAANCARAVSTRQDRRLVRGRHGGRGLRGGLRRGARWHSLGERIGEAYQIADDIRDVVSSEEELGKPTGRDQALGRPNAVHRLGIGAPVERLEELVESAIDAIPECPRRRTICGRTSRPKRAGCCRASWRGRRLEATRAVSWTDRYLAIRDRWLSSPRFQRWAAAFPLTRPTARRRARALFDVCAGFVYSQILFACVRLRLFELLAKGPHTARRHRRALLNCRCDSTERLLEAAVSLRLVEKRARGRFGLGPLGAALIGNPAVGAP